MNRQLTEDLHQYFLQKTVLTSDENYLLTRLTGELPYFPISHICRDDLESKGFEISNVTDSVMSKLADKLGNDYCEQLFWISMGIIAEECLKIPRHICPKCGEKRLNTIPLITPFSVLHVKTLGKRRTHRTLRFGRISRRHILLRKQRHRLSLFQ